MFSSVFCALMVTYAVLFFMPGHIFRTEAGIFMTAEVCALLLRLLPADGDHIGNLRDMASPITFP